MCHLRHRGASFGHVLLKAMNVVGDAFVVEPKLMKHGGEEIGYSDRILLGPVANFIGLRRERGLP